MGNYVVIGLGRFGKSVAKTLYNNNQTVVVIDEVEEIIQDVVDRNIVSDGIILDATNEKELKKIVNDNFDTAFVCIGSNLESSILITLALKEIGVKNIICKAKTTTQGKVLKKIGATQVIYPEKRMGEEIALRTLHSSIMEYFKFSENYGIFELKAPNRFYNKTLKELDLRKKYDINIIGIKDNVDEPNVNPNPDTIIKEGSILLVMTHLNNVDIFNKF